MTAVKTKTHPQPYPLLQRLQDGGLLTALDVHFAVFIGKLAQTEDDPVPLAAALVSRATGQGNVCLDLAEVADTVLAAPQAGLPVIHCPGLSRWRQHLDRTPVAGRPGDDRPLILDDHHRLYLKRYRDYEDTLATALHKRIAPLRTPVDEARLQDGLQRFFPPDQTATADRQLLAAVTALTRRLCIISGGPGTGKTTTVAKLLALLVEQAGSTPPRIFLTAPTGKAAARLIEAVNAVKATLDCAPAVKSAIPDDAATIHRLLRPVPDTPFFQHNRENLMPADVLVVDEASMVDLALMAKLVQALPETARLILLGDKDQLSSVEAGSVLGDICDRNQSHCFSNPFHKQLQQLISRPKAVPSQTAGTRPGLQDNIILLEKSYRFDSRRGIGALSRAVNAGHSDQAAAILEDPNEPHLQWRQPTGDPETLNRVILDGYRQGFALTDPRAALNHFNRFQILCAVNIGPWGVERINRQVERLLQKKEIIPRLRTEQTLYHGKPLMITVNDYRLGLFNGDIGIVMTEADRLYVYFSDGQGQTRRVLPGRLPAYVTAYALTIHKSQGSEFDQVLLLLPDKDYPVLSRELLYTGITRTKKALTLFSSRTILETTLKKQIKRTSGLRDALWRKPAPASRQMLLPLGPNT